MNLSQLPNDSRFQFAFEEGSKWIYFKLGDKQIRCESCPRPYDATGLIHPIDDGVSQLEVVPL